MKILDIHTHHPAPQPEGIVALSAVELAAKYSDPAAVPLLPGQTYSIGIHPWDTLEAPAAQVIAMLEAIAERPETVAIGEAGIDTLRGGPMFRQLQVFKRQIELSERLRKPLIIHEVKAHDIILSEHGDSKPAQNWCIHGFRLKPTVALPFLRKGIYLSFGAKFNPETVKSIPRERLLAETDDAPETIEQVLGALSETLGRDAAAIASANAAAFLTGNR